MLFFWYQSYQYLQIECIAVSTQLEYIVIDSDCIDSSNKDTEILPVRYKSKSLENNNKLTNYYFVRKPSAKRELKMDYAASKYSPTLESLIVLDNPQSRVPLNYNFSKPMKEQKLQAY